MHYISSILLFLILSIGGCSSETEKANSLGFRNSYQMKEIKKLGFNDYDSFLRAHPFVIESNSKAFANAALGLPIRIFSDVAEGKSIANPLPYVSLRADNNKNVIEISYQCISAHSNSIGAAIDGIGCGPLDKDKIDKSSHYCYPEGMSLSIYFKENAFFYINEKYVVTAFGLTSSNSSMIENLNMDLCSKVMKNVADAARLGFTFVTDMFAARAKGILTAADWQQYKRIVSLSELYNSYLNNLEKTLIISVSKETDYDNFNNNGALDVESKWRGYQVNRAGWNFDESSKTLKGFNLTLKTDILNRTNKPATINNLKQDLIQECDGDWKSHGLKDQTFSQSNFSLCSIEMLSNGFYRVTVTLEKMKNN